MKFKTKKSARKVPIRRTDYRPLFVGPAVHAVRQARSIEYLLFKGEGGPCMRSRHVAVKAALTWRVGLSLSPAALKEKATSGPTWLGQWEYRNPRGTVVLSFALVGPNIEDANYSKAQESGGGGAIGGRWSTSIWCCHVGKTCRGVYWLMMWQKLIG